MAVAGREIVDVRLLLDCDVVPDFAAVSVIVDVRVVDELWDPDCEIVADGGELSDCEPVCGWLPDSLSDVECDAVW